VLGNLQALPTDAKPIKSWTDLDEALYNVTEGIRNVLLQMTSPAIASPTVLGEMRPEITSPYVVEKLALHYTLIGHDGSVLSVALRADGQTLVSGSDDETIKVWNLSTGQELRTLTDLFTVPFTRPAGVRSIALSANGQTLVSIIGNRTIKVWNLSTGQEVRTLTGHTASVLSVALSADGQTLVSGSRDQTIKVWRA
jgi:WD40 repeat protein